MLCPSRLTWALSFSAVLWRSSLKLSDSSPKLSAWSAFNMFYISNPVQVTWDDSALSKSVWDSFLIVTGQLSSRCSVMLNADVCYLSWIAGFGTALLVWWLLPLWSSFSPWSTTYLEMLRVGRCTSSSSVSFLSRSIEAMQSALRKAAILNASTTRSMLCFDS